MQARTFTAARIVALALIALVVLGVVTLRYMSGTAAVSVPEGAHAGQLTLGPCEYPTKNGSYRADCGTLVVPENRADPQSRLIAVPVTRIKARSANPGRPVIRLEGGPGITNMHFPAASWFADDHDVVLVGYRGVDGSSRLDCPEVESAMAHSTDVLSEKSLRAYADGFRTCAQRLTDAGVDLGGYTFVQQVEDLEAARVALGYDRVDLVSESAGTRTAMIYAWRYPGRIERSVMIGVNPPGHFLWDEQTTEEQIRRYADLCSKDDGCRSRTDDLATSIRRTAKDTPGRWLFLPIKEANVRVVSHFGLFETTPTMAPFNGPLTIDSWLAAAGGDASGLWLNSVAGDVLFPTMFVWGQYAAVARIDAAAVREYFYSDGPGTSSNFGRATTSFAWGGGLMLDAWPAAPDEGEYSRVQMSNVETLLIGGELDFSTPPQIATKELLPYLPNGHQVVLRRFGHSGTFWADQPEAGSHLVNTFFDTGRVDDSLYAPASLDFAPGTGQTTLAKGLAATMVTLALLTVLSLLWMGRHVRQRGRFSPGPSALLRSAYPIILGVGGWSLGALIVLTTNPGIPLADGLLAALAVGAPIGMGVYLAWVNRDKSRRARTIGLAAALLGALVGARLGFDAIDGPMAVVTTLAGAIVGANLVLLGLDIASETADRSWRARRTAPAEHSPRQSDPSPGATPVGASPR
jgi:pimeloyl-ACP methyl ester carboxylesterase